MSRWKAKGPKPRHNFCWVCSRRLYGRQFAEVQVDGDEARREIARREADRPEPPAPATGEATTALDAWLNEMRYLKLLNDGHVFFAREHAIADQRAAVKPWRERCEQAAREMGRLRELAGRLLVFAQGTAWKNHFWAKNATDVERAEFAQLLATRPSTEPAP